MIPKGIRSQVMIGAGYSSVNHVPQMHEKLELGPSTTAALMKTVYILVQYGGFAIWAS
jgi:hypothetical protein